MASTSLRDQVVTLTRALAQAGIRYAIGGALALAYHAQPRATTDIDVNLFVSELASGPVLEVLANLGVTTDIAADRRQIERDGQIRLRWDDTNLDLFFSTFAFLDSCAARAVRVPFGATSFTILSAEDLAICKVAFDREKDWLDLRELVTMQGGRLDRAYLLTWLTEILGAHDPRLERFAALVARDG